MEDLLNDYFMPFYGRPGCEPVETIRTNTPRFELADGRPLAFCARGTGDGVFENRRGTDVTVYDYEGHILAQDPRRKWRDSMGKRCDYLLHDDRHFVLCEMTRCKEKYLSPYERGGRPVPGKLDHAKEQMFNTLEKLLAVPKIEERIASFAEKTALFCYKVSDNPQSSADDAMARSHAAFSRPTEIIGNFSQPFSHGFNFEQRLYAEPFVFGTF